MPVTSHAIGQSDENASHQNAGQPVATIADKTITRGALKHWLSISTRQGELPEPPEYTACIERLRPEATRGTQQSNERLRNACRQQYDELLKAALSSLIHAHWLIGEAVAEGLKVDQAKLKHEAANGARGETTPETFSSAHEAAADIKFKLTIAQLSERINRRLERKVPAISHRQISDYYRSHRKSFAVEEQRDLHVLRALTDVSAKQARWEIEHGASFATVVGKSTVAQPDMAQEGLLRGLLPHNWPEPPLSKEIFNAPLKTLGGPVKTSLGYYVFEVIRSVPAHQRSTAEVQPEIETLLRRELHNRVLSRFIAAFRKKWTARTNCLPGYVVKYCRQYKSSHAERKEAVDVL